MRLSDFISDSTQSEEEDLNEKIDLEEVEKTAELLEELSKKDSLLDDLAKLAVLQDIVGQNKEELEKKGFRIFGLGNMSESQAAKAMRRAAAKELRVAEIKDEASKLIAERKLIEKKIDQRIGDKKKSTGAASIAIPFAVGGGVSAAGMAAYYKNKQNKILEQLARYYDERAKSAK
jgi:hypothetical protein